MAETGSKDEESRESSNGKVDESASKDEESKAPSNGKDDESASKNEESMEPSNGKVYESASKNEESKEPSNGKVDESAEYILQFGTDTDVCDEQSRTYKEETLQIKVFVSQLKREINHAEVVKEQLEQDVKHMSTECVSISQRTTDQLNTAKLYSTTVSGAFKSIKNDLAKPTTISNVGNESVERDEETQPKIRDTKDQTQPKAIKPYMDSADSLRITAEDDFRNAAKLKVKIHKIHVEIQKVHDRESSRNLEQRRKMWKIETHAKAEKEKKTWKRNEVLRQHITVLQKRLQNGRYRKKKQMARLLRCVSLPHIDVCHFFSNPFANIFFGLSPLKLFFYRFLTDFVLTHQKERTRTSRIRNLSRGIEEWPRPMNKADVVRAKRISSIQKSIKACDKTTENFKKQIREAAAINSVKKLKLLELAELEIQGIDLSRTKEELTSEYADAILEEEDALKDVQEAECKAAAAEEAKYANNEVEALELLPGRAEVPCLEKEKEYSLALIILTKKRIRERKAERDKKLSDLNGKLSRITVQKKSTEEMKGDLEAKRANLLRIHKQSKKSRQVKLSDLEKIEISSQEAILKIQYQENEVKCIKSKVRSEEGTLEIIEGARTMVRQFAKTVQKCEKSGKRGKKSNAKRAAKGKKKLRWADVL